MTSKQVLVTKPDFFNDQTREQLFTTIDELLQLNIIPIINTNDAVSPPPQKDEDPEGVLGIKDNDSLAARVAVETRFGSFISVNNNRSIGALQS